MKHLLRFTLGLLGSLAAFSPAASALDVYRERVQPIFDRRCIACHACFTAPCQLNLSAYEGVDRGATQEVVYNSNRLVDAEPTRLFEDAQTTNDWRQRLGFFPVIRHAKDSLTNLDGSLLFKLLTQKMVEPRSTGKFNAEGEFACPKNAHEANQFIQDKPFAGMPYGFPALSSGEYETIIDWMRDGAPGPLPQDNRAALPVLSKWETFLNQDIARSRISSRYIYEHLFSAHVHFDELPGEFYRLVRSRVPAPAPVDEIATRRPYDGPGVARVYYRFKRYAATPVRKNHIPYRLNDAKMRRYRELFLDSTWANAHPHIPGYEGTAGANPFIVFQDIPARSRYQFMLDDAYFHVMAFIYGSVCKGQVALNVIDDHFNIFFLDPAADPTVTTPGFLPKVAHLLALPAQGETGMGSTYTQYKLSQLRYRKKRLHLYEKRAAQGRMLTDLWDGDGVNGDAVLTVFRNYDSADVLRGAHGGIPKTAWVMDYPIFERMYYNLVAGFDVYGNIIHQTSTRRYMDNLRIESEDAFLTFLPSNMREKVRKYWYRGWYARIKMFIANRQLGKDIETRVKFADPAHAKEEFLRMALTDRMSASVRGPADPLNDHGLAAAARSSDGLARVLSQFTRVPGAFTQVFPEVSFVRVGVGSDNPRAFTILRNKGHFNISSMLLEKAFRDDEDDELVILPGLVGAFPNFYFDVATGLEPRFVEDIKKLRPKDGSFARFVEQYGVRRMDPRFWSVADWFNDQLRADPITFGVLDLSRYRNY